MKRYLFIVLLFQTSLSTAQYNTSLGKTIVALDYYFATANPVLHLHLNKTTYTAGEDIWYTAYAFERITDKIDYQPHNVVVTLLDSDNNEISKQLIYLANGVANNNIFIKPDLQDGTYYIKAFTANMNNYTIDESFVQPIQIINSRLPNTQQFDVERHYDIQLQPEGGHFVEGIKNTVGIKVLDNFGKSAIVKKITLLDSNNTIVLSNILVNDFGMARFEYVPEEGKTYMLQMHLEDYIVLKSVPKAKMKGLILNTNLNYNSGQLNVVLTTNKSTLKDIENEQFYLMLHKDQETKTYDVSFEENYTQLTFQIPNKELFSGVNIITLFNSKKQPILERVFFNHKSLKKVDLSISKVSSSKDTISYALHSKVRNTSVKSNLSISVLPENTVANMHRSSLLANVYLKPFINGLIENGNYYFNDTFSYKKKYELDLLLLNQGWSKYSWNTIFNKPPSDFYSSEFGITIDGYVSVMDDKAIPKQVFLYSKSNEKMDVAEIYDGNKFTFTNLVISNNSSFDLSLANEEGTIIKANFFYTIAPKDKARKSIHKQLPDNPFEKQLSSQPILDLESDVEQLDEVVINASNKKYEKYFSGWDSWKVDSTNTSIGNLANLISKYGYYKTYTYEGFTLVKTIYDMKGTSRIQITPSLVIDGQSYRAHYAQMLAMEDIDEIYVDRPLGKKSHVFVVFTKRNWNKGRLPKTAKSFTITHEGFTESKSFYTPKYFYNSASFMKFGVLGWFPQQITNEKGYAVFSMYSPKNTGLKFFIEGFTEEGDPISSVVTLPQEEKRQ